MEEWPSSDDAIDGWITGARIDHQEETKLLRQEASSERHAYGANASDAVSWDVSLYTSGQANAARAAELWPLTDWSADANRHQDTELAAPPDWFDFGVKCANENLAREQHDKGGQMCDVPAESMSLHGGAVHAPRAVAQDAGPWSHGWSAVSWPEGAEPLSSADWSHGAMAAAPQDLWPDSGNLPWLAGSSSSSDEGGDLAEREGGEPDSPKLEADPAAWARMPTSSANSMGSWPDEEGCDERQVHQDALDPPTRSPTVLLGQRATVEAKVGGSEAAPPIAFRVSQLPGRSSARREAALHAAANLAWWPLEEVPLDAKEEPQLTAWQESAVTGDAGCSWPGAVAWASEDKHGCQIKVLPGVESEGWPMASAVGNGWPDARSDQLPPTSAWPSSW